MLQICLKYKNTILLTWIAFILLSGAAILRHIFGDEYPIDNSVSVWFMRDDEELITYEQYNSDFEEQEWTVLLLEADNVYAPNFLIDMRQIVQRIETLDHVIKVNSIVNIRDNELMEDDSLSYSQVYPEEVGSLPLSGEQIKQFIKKLERNPIFHKSILDRQSSKHTVLLIQNANLIHNLEPYRITLVDAIREIVADYDTVKSHALAGTTVVNAELNRASLHDVYVFYILITLMLILFGYITLRNVKDVIILLMVVVGSMLPTMGLISVLGIPFNMVSVMLPVVLIALSVADSVHVIHDFHLERQSKSAEEAIKASIRMLWNPSLWTSITTVVGFASLATSTVYPIFQLGIFASFGIILAWLTTVLLVPQLLVRCWSKQKKVFKHREKNWPSLGGMVLPLIKKGRIPLLILFILLFVPVFGLVYIDVDTNYTKFFSKSMELTRAYDDIDKAGFAQNPVVIALQYPDELQYGDKKYHQGLLDFEYEIRKQPEVIKLLTLNDLLIEVDKTFNGEYPTSERFAGYSQEQLLQLLFLAELSGNDDINDFMVDDKDQIQLLAMTPYISSRELQDFRARVKKLKEQYLPDDIQMNITGTTVLWANMDQQVSRTQIFSLMAISIFMVIFLPLNFGSLRLGLIGVVMNFLPLGVTLGLMSYLGIKVNMATALIGGISLGIVVDDTLHMIYRVRLYYQRGMPWHQAVDEAVSSIGSSVIMTSVILVGGFLCMATSSFVPSAHFGLFISLSIIVALFLDLFILPILIKTSWITPSFVRLARK